MKRLLPFVSALSLIIVVIIGTYLYRNVNGFYIEITNNTDVAVFGLKITYNNIAEDIELPIIKGGEKYNLTVNPTEEFGENAMYLYYTDNYGNIQKNVLIGYFEKGYNGRIKVTINEVRQNGVIIMGIQEDLFI